MNTGDLVEIVLKKPMLFITNKKRKSQFESIRNTLESIRHLNETNVNKNQSKYEVIKQVILDFKYSIERQCHVAFRRCKGSNVEECGRSKLQIALELGVKGIRVEREVSVRGGNVDLMIYIEEGTFIIETKVWRGMEYYLNGLVGMEKYIKGEIKDLCGVFYVIFDPLKKEKAAAKLGGYNFQTTILNQPVDQIVIDINLPQPSTKRQKLKKEEIDAF